MEPPPKVHDSVAEGNDYGEEVASNQLEAGGQGGIPTVLRELLGEIYALCQ